MPIKDKNKVQVTFWAEKDRVERFDKAIKEHTLSRALALRLAMEAYANHLNTKKRL